MGRLSQAGGDALANGVAACCHHDRYGCGRLARGCGTEYGDCYDHVHLGILGIGDVPSGGRLVQRLRLGLQSCWREAFRPVVGASHDVENRQQLSKIAVVVLGKAGMVAAVIGRRIE